MSALRRIPALTPDSMGKAARATDLKRPIAARRTATAKSVCARSCSGVDVFKRNRDLPQERFGSDSRHGNREALALLPHLTSMSEPVAVAVCRRPCVASRQIRSVRRVLTRLRHRQLLRPTEDRSGGVLHGDAARDACTSHIMDGATCVEADPLCHICPLRSECPFPHGAASMRRP